MSVNGCLHINEQCSWNVYWLERFQINVIHSNVAEGPIRAGNSLPLLFEL